MISELDAARLDVLQVSEYAINRKDRDNQRDSKADFLIHRASMSVDWDDAWLPASWLCFPTPVPVTVTGARPARLKVELHDLVWEAIYAPLAASINFAADRFNRFQFLTIRQFLTLVFCTLIVLLLVLAIWT